MLLGRDNGEDWRGGGEETEEKLPVKKRNREKRLKEINKGRENDGKEVMDESS